MAYSFRNTVTSRRGQRGVVLAIVLIFLVILSLVSVAAMRTNILEERLAGNSRDWQLAFQAAEAALRNAEADITAGTRVVGESGFSSACTNGLCAMQTDGTPIWRDLDTSGNTGWVNGADATPSIKYGTYGTPTPSSISVVSKQPRYIIEVLRDQIGGSLAQGSGYGTKPLSYYYRITARGFGASVDDNGNPLARVTLQSTFKP